VVEALAATDNRLVNDPSDDVRELVDGMRDVRLVSEGRPEVASAVRVDGSANPLAMAVICDRLMGELEVSADIRASTADRPVVEVNEGRRDWSPVTKDVTSDTSDEDETND